MKVDKDIKPYVHETRKRKWMLGMNALGAVILLAVLFGMINYVSFRHYRRWDVSRNRFFALSDKTVSLLNTVTNPLRVTVFFTPEQPLYEDIKNLLQEYEYACRNLRVEWVDPDRDLARLEELAGQYDVDDINVVVFDNNGRSQYVTAADIATYDYEPLQAGQRPVQTSFAGEQAFSSAIMSITQQRRPIVYFIQGHGEGNPHDPDKRRGFSKIARAIERDNIDLRVFRFGEVDAVPEDCDALIVAGPQMDFTMTELDKIAAYLENSGRVMIMIDAEQDTALDELLMDWGVRLGRDLVVDPARTITGRGDLVVTAYYDHPVTENLSGVTSVFYLPRSVRPLEFEQDGDLADKPHVALLAATTDQGWGETNLEEVEAQFDPEEDVVGPVPVMVAVEKGPVPGIDVQIRPTRLIVAGDSDFVANKGAIGGNVQLFMSGLNWLLERDELLNVGVRSVEQSKLVVNRTQRKLIFWIVVGIMPGITAVIGILVWFRRRS